MRKNFGIKPWLYPQPVLIISSYNEDGSANAMNAAWGGTSKNDEISICVSEHKTTENIIRNRAFTVSIGDISHVIECDYVGIVSGNNVPDKLAKANFTISKSEFVNAPIINELPMALECALVSYDKDTERMVGKIVNISVDEKALNDKGEIASEKLEAIIFDPIEGVYRKVGEKVGKAFSDGAKIK